MVKHALYMMKGHTDEVSIYFVTMAEICRLHQEFFGDPSPTDCISFPIDQKNEGAGYHVLGEIFVSPQAALDYVMRQSEEINEDCYRETSLYVIHGLLHLLGYDDIRAEDKMKMEREQNRLMKELIEKNLLLRA